MLLQEKMEKRIYFILTTVYIYHCIYVASIERVPNCRKLDSRWGMLENFNVAGSFTGYCEVRNGKYICFGSGRFVGPLLD